MSKTPKNVVFDIDGVLADYNRAVYKKFKRRLPAMDSKLTSAEGKALRNDESFWINMALLPGGELLQQRSPLPRNYYLLTARPNDLYELTRLWLQANHIKLYSPDHLILANPNAAKLTYLSTLSLCAYLDDYLPIVAVANQYNGIDAYMLKQPWNELAVRYFEQVRMVNSVASFLVEVEK